MNEVFEFEAMVKLGYEEQELVLLLFYILANPLHIEHSLLLLFFEMHVKLERVCDYEYEKLVLWRAKARPEETRDCAYISQTALTTPPTHPRVSACPYLSTPGWLLGDYPLGVFAPLPGCLLIY